MLNNFRRKKEVGVNNECHVMVNGCRNPTPGQIIGK